MFSVGSKIVHPMHGAGIIQKIEEKKILGEVKQYYILKLPCNDMNVMIPVDSEQSVGIREIVDESAVRGAIEILREDSTAEKCMLWKSRVISLPRTSLSRSAMA